MIKAYTDYLNALNWYDPDKVKAAELDDKKDPHFKKPDGKAYKRQPVIQKGENYYNLMQDYYENNRTSNEYGTAKQWNREKRKIKKGEKGTPLILLAYTKETDEETGEEREVIDTSRRAPLRTFYVFNYDQTEPMSEAMIATMEKIRANKANKKNKKAKN